MIEEWRSIEGYEGLYEVSSYGRVRSLDRYDNRNYFRKGKVLSPGKTPNGYLVVVLSCNEKQKTITVHRLVAQAFIPNPDNLLEVNHKDEDKTNNSVDNLEWCDHSYNNNYGSRMDKVRKTKELSGYWTGVSKTKDYHKKYIKEYYHIYYQENREKILMRLKEYRRKKKEQIQNNVH